MKTYKITAVYPLYYEVEAENEKQAERIALEEADYYLNTSSVKPVIHEIVEEQ